MASSPHAGELGTVLVSGTEMQEGQKVLEASQACSVCGVKPGAQCQMWLPFKVGGATGKEGAHRLSWPEDCVRRLYRGCSDVSEGDRSGMEREVDDRVVAMEAVVASSKDGGVQGRRSGRPSSSSVG